MERVLEVGGLVRGEDADQAVVRDHPGQLGHVGLGVGEVLDQVGRAGPVEAGRRRSRGRARPSAPPGGPRGRSGRPPSKPRRTSSRRPKTWRSGPGSGRTRSPGHSPHRGCARRRCARGRPGSPPRAGRAASRGSHPAAAARPSAGSWCWWPRALLPSHRATPRWRGLLTLPSAIRPPLHDHHPSPPPPPGGGMPPPARRSGQRRRPGRQRRRRPGRATGAAGRGDRRALVRRGLAVRLAYVPLLAVRPGVVTPDTKTYLYLDPTRFLSQVAFMWNPTVGLGTVNHQYIGYLLPMGPFFAVFHLLGVPGLGGPAPVARLDPLRRRASASSTSRGSSGCGARGRRPPRWPTCSRRTSCSTPGGSR